MLDYAIIGLIAASCTTISFIPQVHQIYKTKDTSSISLGMYVLFVLGIFLWFCYGILISDLPLILANLVTLILSSAILTMKVLYSQRT